MTTENLQQETDSTNQSVDTENKSVVLNAEDLAKQNKDLEAKFLDAVSTRDKAKAKVRDLEVTLSSKAEIEKELEAAKVEREKLFTQFESTQAELNTIKQNIRVKAIDSALTAALEAAGARSVNTVMKLIDKSSIEVDESGQIQTEKVVGLIQDLINSDPILFNEASEKKDVVVNGNSISNPSVRRASNTPAQDAFTVEIKSAKSQREVDAILTKYNKK